MDGPRRRGARREDQLATGQGAQRGAARGRAAAFRQRAGDTGRAEGADDPRLLHASAAPVSVRSRRGGPFRGARRGVDLPIAE